MGVPALPGNCCRTAEDPDKCQESHMNDETTCESGAAINPGSVPSVHLPEDVFTRAVRSSQFEHYPLSPEQL